MAVLCVCEISACVLRSNVETTEIYNLNGQRVSMSNCHNVKTFFSVYYCVSCVVVFHKTNTVPADNVSRLVCDTQYVSGKDTVFHSPPPWHSESLSGDVVTCCDNRWRHCFVTSLHRWWMEQVGPLNIFKVVTSDCKLNSKLRPLECTMSTPLVCCVIQLIAW